MTRQPRPKRRGKQAKSTLAATEAADSAVLRAEHKKTDTMAFRTLPSLRADLEKAAAASGRSVSEQIQHAIGRFFEWERVLGDLEAFKADLAAKKAYWAEAQRQIEAAERHRAGWGKMYDPSVPGGVVPLPPGMHNIPHSGFVDPNAPPPAITLPPVLAEAVRAEVKSAVEEALEKAGLLSKKKTGGAAA